jgi:uncharacterized protein (DUF2141 family)
MKWILIIFLMSIHSSFANEVTLKFTETKNKPGRILIAVFDDPKEFPDKKAFLNKIIPVTKEASDYEVRLDLPLGNYAISIFLDENHNNVLDKNFLGIPKERFGFSKNPPISTGAPGFYECEVEVKNDNHNFEIKLIKLL